jgi:hypothetical protein
MHWRKTATVRARVSGECCWAPRRRQCAWIRRRKRATHLARTEDGEQNREKLAQDGQQLVFGELVAHELGEDLHRAVDRVGVGGGDEGDEGVEQVRILVRPVALGDRREGMRLTISR